MKFLFSLLIASLFSTGALAQPAAEAYRVGNAEVSCLAANGQVIRTTDRENDLVESRWGLFRKEYSLTLNPAFFRWTWIIIGEAGALNIQGTQIFLLGNAPAGRKTTLTGFLGKVIGAPAFGGMAYPVGFLPQAAISCSVYWENTIPR